jgi:hypothetical protein
VVRRREGGREGLRQGRRENEREREKQEREEEEWEGREIRREREREGARREGGGSEGERGLWQASINLNARGFRSQYIILTDQEQNY